MSKTLKNSTEHTIFLAKRVKKGNRNKHQQILVAVRRNKLFKYENVLYYHQGIDVKGYST